MAHVGRLYPVHFRRDLSIAWPYPQLLPNRWVYGMDNFNVDNDVGQHRFGVVSDPGILLPPGQGLSWLFSYAGDAGVACEITFTMLIVNHGRPNISNLPGILWTTKFNNAAAIGSGTITSFGFGSFPGYPIFYEPVNVGDVIGPLVATFGFIFNVTFGTPLWNIGPKGW